MATDGGLSELVAELRAGGEVESRGRFTLDRAQARAKMQRFQLDDARRYVLELVQAAVLAGARSIAFEIDADDMRMRFDGRPFTAAELEDVWGSIFADEAGADLRAVRQLALGLNAALGLDPRWIVVRSGSQQLRLASGGAEALETIDPPEPGTLIHVKRRLGFGLVVAWLHDLKGRLAEETYLRDRCRHAEVAITLDGRPIAGGMKVAEAWIEAPLAGPGVRGVIGLVADSTAPAELRLVKDGVWIDTSPLAGVGPGVVAVAEGERLRKDVSLARIVADEGLEQIAGLVRAARWGLLARALERCATHEWWIMPRIRQEVLQFLRFRDLRKRPEAAALTQVVPWMDARRGPDGKAPIVTLAALAEAVRSEEGTRELRFATASYPALLVEGPPIPQIQGEEVGQVARILGCEMRAVDAELARAQRREQGRQAWRKRAMPPTLPTTREYLARAPVSGPGIRGEVGVGVHAVRGETPPPGKLWLIAEGCLLTLIEVDWGPPGVELAVEARFSPSELFDDAVPDATLVEVVLRALEALGGALADLVERTVGTTLAAGARGLVKAWLLLALEDGALAEVWRRLRLPEAEVPDAQTVQRWLPTATALREGCAGKLLELPLFEDYDGASRSLAELRRRREQSGSIRMIERSVKREPGLGHEVAWLGKGDCRIVTALLGQGALESWGPMLAQMRRERKFMSQPERSLQEMAHAAREELRAAGLDPELWWHMLRVDGVEAVLVLRPQSDPSVEEKETPPGRIELLFAGRSLVTRTIPLGFGPIWGVASGPSLRPNARWDDVESEEALAPVVRALCAGAWALARGLVRRQLTGAGVDATTWARLRGQLLRQLAERPREEVLAAAPEVAEVPLLATLDGKLLSLAQVDAVVREYRRIELVPTTTPEAPLTDPPIVREGPVASEALRRWVRAARVVDGAPRVRAYRLQRRLSDLPPATALALDRARVWSVTSLASPGSRLAGEVGLRREDLSATLRVEVCLEGRKLGEFVHEDMPAPLAALVCDPELPITSTAEVNTRSKRYIHLLRLCRRAAPRLIGGLCERFAGLSGAEREEARSLLLDYAARRVQQSKRDGSAPGPGVEAVRRLPLLTDVWGEPLTPAALEERLGETIEVVTRPVTAPPRSVRGERMIVLADAPARRYLAALGAVVELDDRWEEELAALRALEAAPRCVLPELDEVAWVAHKATIAGGLQAHIWIPRTPSPGESVALTRQDRELGRAVPLPGLPCAGIVRGEGIRGGVGAAQLDQRQRNSLARQVCRLYESLAKQVSASSFPAHEREAARAWLLRADAALAEMEASTLAPLGKAVTDLQEVLATLAPPTLRKTRAPTKKGRTRAEAERATAAAVEAPPRAQPATPAGEAGTPELRLLALVREELSWARARHGSLLERLRLDRLAIAPDRGPGIARFEQMIVLHGRHPLIARALARLASGEAPDPVDMMFVLANVYTLMNEVAEEIGADDEQAFVARLAEGLATGLAQA
jgi:hypothetical protein